MMNGPHGDGGRRGNMPFAVVAIALLMIASAYAVTSSSMNDTMEDAENVEDGIDAVDSAVSGISSFVKMGLGEIVHDVSTDPDLGLLNERRDTFDIYLDLWMSAQFPAVDSGVRVNVTSYDAYLGTHELTVNGGILSGNGYTPSYLRATCEMTAVFESDSGRSERTFTIVSDGSCALPLVVEAASMFEEALTGEGSLLSQIMTYQLTSLAQTRVLAGYGSTERLGNSGTLSVITENDVKQAYESAVFALESLYFRNSSGEEYYGNIDLASAFVASDGDVCIDLGTVYAQVLSAKVDDIATKWFDYFLGNKALRICDYVDDALKNAWDSFTSFLTGKNNRSAEPYIREILKGNEDLDIRTGESFIAYVQAADGTGWTEVSVGYPDVDLFSSPAVTDFVKNYRGNTNTVREWIYSVLNASAKNAADSMGLPTVRIGIEHDGSFPETLTQTVISALTDSSDSLTDLITESVKDDRLPDQMYAAIFDSISRDKTSIFSYGETAFWASAREDLLNAVLPGYIETYGDTEGYALACEAVDAATVYGPNRETAISYDLSVDSLIDSLSALKEVESSGSNVVERGCIGILSGGMLIADGAMDMGPAIVQVCSEFAENMSVNPMTGDLVFPETDSFVIEGEISGEEYLRITDTSNPTAHVGIPDTSMNTHQTGFNDESGASYCTAYRVTLTDVLTYEVSSSGTLTDALGICNSSLRSTAAVDLALNISVVSGWGLIGADYEASTTVLDDIRMALLKVLEPILDPLRDILRVAQEAMNSLSDSIAKLGSYASDIILKIYESAIVPIQEMISTIKEKFGNMFSEKLIDLTNELKAIVGIDTDEQTIGFSYMGFSLSFTFDLGSLDNYTKNLVTAEMSFDVCGVAVSSWVSVIVKGGSYNAPRIIGNLSLVGSDWNVSGDIDPLMSTNDNILAIEGTFKGYDVKAVLPELVQYRELSLSLADIPAVGQVLSNIPSPIPGTKVSLDAGFEIKYDAPMIGGVLINEFESNPAGEDADEEWAEILNYTRDTVDLTDWVIQTEAGRTFMIGEVKLLSGGRTVIEFEGNFLRNSGESLTLVDPDGSIISVTPTKSDSYNDGRSCQRGADGSTEWVMCQSTRGEKNCGGLLGEDGILHSVAVNIVKEAAVEALKEIGDVNDTDSLAALLQLTASKAIDKGIDALSDCLVEASIFVTVELTDLTSSGRAGFTAYVKADERLAEDLLRYVIGKAGSMLLNIEDPYGIDLGESLCNGVFVGITVYGGVSAPSFLDIGNTKVTLGIDVSCNASLIGSVIGKDLGTPELEAGVVIRNCPSAAIPAGLSHDSSMQSDLWLLRLSMKKITE